MLFSFGKIGQEDYKTKKENTQIKKNTKILTD